MSISQTAGDGEPTRTGPSPAPTIDDDAMLLADIAFIETEGSNGAKVRAAVWAYLWALANPREIFGMSVYPSGQELREALAARGSET